MAKKAETASFVLRFTQKIYNNDQGEPQVQWRGNIRHVQDGAEKRFTDFEDAITFVQQKLSDLTLQAVEHHTPEEQKGILAKSFDIWKKMTADAPKLVLDSLKDPRKQVANIQEQVHNQLQHVGEMVNQRIEDAIQQRMDKVDEWRGVSKSDYKQLVRMLEQLTEEVAELRQQASKKK